MKKLLLLVAVLAFALVLVGCPSPAAETPAATTFTFQNADGTAIEGVVLDALVASVDGVIEGT